MSNELTADQMVDEFAALTGTGKWRNITRDQVVKGLKARLAAPDSLNQLNANVCGPTVLVHILLQDNPKAYVQMVVQLYDTSTTVFKGMALKPRQDLLDAQPPAGQNQADWIILASIRDNYNWFYHYNKDGGTTHKDDEKAGGTTPGEIKDWLKALGYTKIEDGLGWFYGSQDFHNADEATKFFNDHYSVVLFINADMLEKAKQQKNQGHMNHVVQLTSAFRFPVGTAEFDCFTWGTGHRQVAEDRTNFPLRLLDFCNNYFGYVAAKH